MNAFPRTLLLTWWPPTLRYAGGEFIRRLVRLLPAEQLKWAYLSPVSQERTATSCECQPFVPLTLHWRLRKTKLASVVTMEWAGHGTAKRIAEWVRPWQPQVLWVLPELAAVGVARHLRILLGIPVHLTLHDVFESAGFSELPNWYVPSYVHRATDLVRKAHSLDGISPELIEYACTQAFGPQPPGRAFRSQGAAPQDGDRRLQTMVFPPSVSKAAIAKAPPCHDRDGCFRLALCGSMRTQSEQWMRFVRGLTSLHKQVELVAIGDAIRQADMAASHGVRIVRHDYFEKEADLIAYLQASRVDAGYAGYGVMSAGDSLRPHLSAARLPPMWPREFRLCSTGRLTRPRG